MHACEGYQALATREFGILARRGRFHTASARSSPFPHVPKAGPSVLKCDRIQRAGSGTGSHFQQIRADHGCGYVRMSNP